MSADSPRFIEARARLHEARRQEAQLAFDLMVEFIKLRQGDVNGAELGDLFHRWGLSYPATMYIGAREKAGVPLKKKLNRKANSRGRISDLRAQFKFLLDTTPDEKKPRTVEALTTQVLKAPERERVAVPLIEPGPAFNIQTVSTEVLIHELKRREEEAERLLRTLGKLPTVPDYPTETK